jgi:hypothetical protein
VGLRSLAGASALLALSITGPALAYGNMTCAQATALVANHPGVEAASIITMATNQWRAMDRRTVAAGHAAIEPRMVQTNVFINALSAQCSANPGQLFRASVAQVYRVAREQFDGY